MALALVCQSGNPISLIHNFVNNDFTDHYLESMWKGGLVMNTFVVVKDAVVEVKKVVETSASKVNSSEVASLLDACTCTGNCC